MFEIIDNYGYQDYEYLNEVIRFTLNKFNVSDAILNVILQFVVGNWSLILSTLIGALIGMYIVDDSFMEASDD